MNEKKQIQIVFIILVAFMVLISIMVFRTKKYEPPENSVNNVKQDQDSTMIEKISKEEVKNKKEFEKACKLAKAWCAKHIPDYYNFETLKNLQRYGFVMVDQKLEKIPDGSMSVVQYFTAHRTFNKRDITIDFSFADKFGEGIVYWVDAY